MGAGTFLSSRRFWEIRDSYRAGLTPGLPFLPSPESPLVPQSRPSALHPQGGPLPTALHPQTLRPSSSEFTSTLRPSPNLFPQTLFPQLSPLSATVLRLSQPMPPPSDPLPSLYQVLLSQTGFPLQALLPQALLPLTHPQRDPPAPSPSAPPSPHWAKPRCAPPRPAWAQSHRSTCHRMLQVGGLWVAFQPHLLGSPT